MCAITPDIQLTVLDKKHLSGCCKTAIVIAMNTESRPGGDEVLHALNAVAETLGGESYVVPADSVVAAQSGAHTPGSPESGAGGSGGGNGGEQDGTPPQTGTGGGGKVPRPPLPPGGDTAPGENPDPDPGIRIMLPNGMAVNTNDLIRRSEVTGESATRASVLKPGDLVVFNAPPEEGSELTDRDRGAVFEVSSAEWINTGAGVTPQVRVKGTLRSTDLPPEVTDREVEFVGSGFGGASIRNNVLTTDLPPYFEGPNRQQIILDDYKFAETFRPSDEGIDTMSPNQLEQQARANNPHHARCVEQLTELGTAHGMNVRQHPEDRVEPAVLRSDEEAYAVSSGDPQSGNVITTLERQGKTWSQARYVNDNNGDVLQVTIADLSGVNVRQTFPFGIHETSAVNRSPAPTLTYTSSNGQGIEATVFRPGLEDTIQELGMPTHPGGRTYRPDIHITPDGQVSLETSGPVGIAFQENPGSEERVRAAIRVETAPDGTRTLRLGRKSYTLPTPEDIMGRITGIVEGRRT